MPWDWTTEARELGKRAKILFSGRTTQSGEVALWLAKVAGGEPSVVNTPSEGLPETVDHSAPGAIAAGSGMEVAKSSPMSLKNNFLSEPSMILTFNYFGQSRFLLLIAFSFALVPSHFLRQIS
ncbi:MAG: hypothetical protein ABIR24_06225 [Verrucomicrobiota bacterium]